ncbi:response regulator [[Kitasatospora] papulosa]|uniref:response regulator n=1 Tax=Streptomyces TaxID=1883 RepID=UPI002E12C3B4|nr:MULTISPECIES: response regulator [unclassified Streptomyces]WSI31423.1 response regulator [Streptomyces sp. NBC_01341]WSQ84777.1 response regulator [Streptomyces sp. NBC_01212]
MSAIADGVAGEGVTEVDYAVDGGNDDDVEPDIPDLTIAFPEPSPEWTVVIVEDNEDFRKDVEDQLRRSDVAYGRAPRVIPVAEFSQAEEVLSAQTVDVVILDVRDDEGRDDAGELILDNLKSTRFVPVVFYTAYTERVEPLAQPPVVQVVGKEEHTDVLINAVKAAFDSGLPIAVRGLADHVREVTREYLWDISKQWASLGNYDAEEKITFLTARLTRSLELTLSLDGEDRLRGPVGRALELPSNWHPSRIYVIPPIGDNFDTGDLLLHADTQRYWVQLTPGCDLANGKADRHLLVAASPLLEVDPFRAWSVIEPEWRSIEKAIPPRGGWNPEEKGRRMKLKKNSSDLRAESRRIILGRHDRYFHLPQFFTVPDLLIDLQHVKTPTESEMGEYARISGLASPWPQVLVNRYNRQTGRMGFDDPDADAVLERISRDMIKRRGEVSKGRVSE